MAFDVKLLSATLAVVLAGCAAPPVPSPADALASAVERRPVVLLGEVHDNEAQHALRAQALRRLVERGARPAVAFEQFDRERQADLDRARGSALPAGVARADYIAAQAGLAKGWNWNFYRPYLQLALDYDLPIVAANLSRADATRVAKQDFSAAFDRSFQAEHGLDRLSPEFLREHERAVAIGHCNLMPESMLPALARAQIARDLALAMAIRPYIGRGVVLLAGNGHVRNDIGVPFFLSADERARAITIGLLEKRAAQTHEPPPPFDVVILTPVQPREDPCEKLRRR